MPNRLDINLGVAAVVVVVGDVRSFVCVVVVAVVVVWDFPFVFLFSFIFVQ